MAACIDTSISVSVGSNEDDALAEKLQAKVVEWRAASSTEYPLLASQIASAILPLLTIAVRIRPISSSEQITIGTRIVGLSSSSTVRSEFENVSVQPSAAKVFLHSEERRFGLPTGELSTKAFEVHTALGPETSDDALFSTLGEPLVLNTLEGGRSCVIAYGQTGSGKTHTSRGLVKRVAKQIFDHLERTASTSISVYVSFLENQGSKCFDLLHNRASVMLREDGQGGVLCVGLSEVHCNTYDDLISTFSIGNDLRLTAATSSNDFSSRSHAICDIILRQDCSEDSLEASLASNREHGSIVGSLRIVDLAGSERVQDTSFHSSDRLRETKEINTSLSCLKDCIRALYLNQKKSSNSGKGTPGHIPFRNSKLTMILRDSFQDSTPESSSKLFTAFIAHACPVASCASHTQNTLDYASAILATSRATKERSRFVGPEKWTTDQVMEWVGTLDGGRLKPLAGAVRYSGKALSVVWRGELVDNFVARGGSVADADFVYDEFRALLKQSKAAANKSKGALSNHALEATRGASESVAPFSFSGLGSDPASN